MGKGKNNTNELIKQRRKKRRIKRNIILAILFAVTAVILCYKLPYFNIKTVTVINNKTVDKNEVIKLSNIGTGKNIFSINKGQIRDKILSNTYIKDVVVKRKLPAEIILDIKERKIQYFIPEGNDVAIVDSEGCIVDRLQSIDKTNLVQLTGIETSAISVGKKVSEDTKSLNQIEVFSDLITRNLTDIKITAIDLTDSANINVYFHDLLVKVGNINEMQDKLNKALNIISQRNLKEAKGYIDVSFKGTPVMALEK